MVSLGICLLFGIAGKESAVIMLGLVPLTSWWMGGRHTHRITLVCAAVGLFGLWSVGGNIGEEVAVRMTWLPWLLIQSAATLRLTGLAFLVGIQTPDFDYYRIYTLLGWLSVGVLLLLAAVSGRLAWVRHPISYGLLWFLIAIMPRLIIQTPKSVFNEHQFYVPFMGLILAAAGIRREA